MCLVFNLRAVAVATSSALAIGRALSPAPILAMPLTGNKGRDRFRATLEVLYY